MSDVDVGALLAALQGASQESEARSPFRGFTSGGNAIGQAVVQGSPGRGTSDIIKSAIVGGLISGVGSNLTDRYVADQNEKAQNVLLGLSPERPSGMTPSVFGSLNNTRSLFNLGREQQIQDEQRRTNQQIFGSLVPKLTDKNPIVRRRANTVLNQMLGGGQEQQSAGQEQQNTDQELTPFEKLTLEYGSEEAANAQLRRDIEEPERKEDDRESLKNQFIRLPLTQDYQLSMQALSSLRRAMADPRGTSDIEIIRAAFQAIEPQGIVREGEALEARLAGSIPGALSAKLDSILTGNSKLEDDVREGLLAIAERRFAERQKVFNVVRDSYVEDARRRGFSAPETLDPFRNFEMAPPYSRGNTSVVGAGQPQPSASRGATPPPPDLSFEDFKKWKKGVL